MTLTFTFWTSRMLEGILTGQFSKRSVALTGWLILYTAGNLIWSWGLDYAHISEISVYASFLHLQPIIFDIATKTYRLVGSVVGKAFHDGLKLK